MNDETNLDSQDSGDSDNELIKGRQLNEETPTDQKETNIVKQLKSVVDSDMNGLDFEPSHKRRRETTERSGKSKLKSAEDYQKDYDREMEYVEQ